MAAEGDEGLAPIPDIEAGEQALVEPAQGDPEPLGRVAQLCQNVAQVSQVELGGEVGQGLGQPARVAAPIERGQEGRQTGGETRELASCTLLTQGPAQPLRLVEGGAVGGDDGGHQARACRWRLTFLPGPVTPRPCAGGCGAATGTRRRSWMRTTRSAREVSDGR